MAPTPIAMGRIYVPDVRYTTLVIKAKPSYAMVKKTAGTPTHFEYAFPLFIVGSDLIISYGNSVHPWHQHL